MVVPYEGRVMGLAKEALRGRGSATPNRVSMQDIQITGFDEPVVGHEVDVAVLKPKDEFHRGEWRIGKLGRF